MFMDYNANIAADYLKIFFNDLENLTAQYALYVNALLITNQKSQEEDNSIEEEKNSLIQITQTTRFWAIRAYIHYKALLKSNLNLKPNIQIEDYYLRIVSINTPKADDIQGLCIEFNSLFVVGIISQQLDNLANTLSQV